MLVANWEQAIICDRRGPSSCIWCQHPVTPPCIFILGAKPGGDKWVHIDCSKEFVSAVTGHAEAHIVSQFGA